MRIDTYRKRGGGERKMTPFPKSERLKARGEVGDQRVLFGKVEPRTGFQDSGSGSGYILSRTEGRRVRVAGI